MPKLGSWAPSWSFDQLPWKRWRFCVDLSPVGNDWRRIWNLRTSAKNRMGHPLQCPWRGSKTLWKALPPHHVRNPPRTREVQIQQVFWYFDDGLYVPVGRFILELAARMNQPPISIRTLIMNLKSDDKNRFGVMVLYMGPSGRGRSQHEGHPNPHQNQPRPQLQMLPVTGSRVCPGEKDLCSSGHFWPVPSERSSHGRDLSSVVPPYDPWGGDEHHPDRTLPWRSWTICFRKEARVLVSNTAGERGLRVGRAGPFTHRDMSWWSSVSQCSCHSVWDRIERRARVMAFAEPLHFMGGRHPQWSDAVVCRGICLDASINRTGAMPKGARSISWESPRSKRGSRDHCKGGGRDCDSDQSRPQSLHLPLGWRRWRDPCSPSILERRCRRRNGRGNPSRGGRKKALKRRPPSKRTKLAPLCTATIVPRSQARWTRCQLSPRRPKFTSFTSRGAQVVWGNHPERFLRPSEDRILRVLWRSHSGRPVKMFEVWCNSRIPNGIPTFATPETKRQGPSISCREVGHLSGDPSSKSQWRRIQGEVGSQNPQLLGLTLH